MRTPNFVCAALAASAALAANAGTVDIELRPQVAVPGGSVSLGDVAWLRSDDLEALKQFIAVPLGQAPRVGASTELTRESLMRWVNARLRPVDTRVNWQGASQVTVQSVAHELSGFLIEQTARASLTGWLKQRATRFSVDPVVQPRDLAVPAGQLELRVRPLPGGDTVVARQRVWVDVHVNNEFVRAIPVDFSVAAYGPAWVAPQAIPRGAMVARQSLERQEVSITAPGFKASAMQPDAVADVRSRRSIAPGGVVAAADVEAIPAVSRGEQVTLVAGSGGLELETRAEALQDGQVGQAVKVRAAGGSAPVLAQVVSPGRVRVQP